MKHLLALAILVTSIGASADQYKTVKKDLSSEKYAALISYPEFFKTSIPAYAKINASLLDTLINNGCDPEDAAASEYGYDYDSSAIVVGLNKKYVGIEISGSNNCGGAHPGYYTYNITYNAQTGEVVDMDKAIPQQDHSFDDKDWEKFEAFQRELAQIMFNHLDEVKNSPIGEDAMACLEDLSHEEILQQLVDFYPTISGLAKNKKVIIRINPPHVATPCGFSVRVNYSEVQKFIAEGSILHQWLK